MIHHISKSFITNIQDINQTEDFPIANMMAEAKDRPIKPSKARSTRITPTNRPPGPPDT